MSNTVNLLLTKFLLFSNFSSVEIKSILKQLSENNNRMCDQPPIKTLVQPPIQTLVQPQIQTLVPIQSQIPVSSQHMNKSCSEASKSNQETDVNSEQVGGLGGSGGLGGPDCFSKIPMVNIIYYKILYGNIYFAVN